MDGLSVSGLADLAGVTEAEVARLVELGILVAWEGAGPFRETDVHKVRLAAACEHAGLPMEGIAAASGLLDLAWFTRVGALTTMEELAADPTVTKRVPLVREALLAGASPQLWNMATIGGNLLQRTRCR